jgi:hypothetical protein
MIGLGGLGFLKSEADNATCTNCTNAGNSDSVCYLVLTLELDYQKAVRMLEIHLCQDVLAWI